jgi:hypothetical protein
MVRKLHGNYNEITTPVTTAWTRNNVYVSLTLFNNSFGKQNITGGEIVLKLNLNEQVLKGWASYRGLCS